MSKLSRTKGRAFEQSVARMLRSYGIPAARGWQSRGGSKEESDVVTNRYTIECKHRQQPNVLRALEQAELALEPGKVPVAVCKWNGTADAKAVVAMRLEDWLVLVNQAAAGRDAL